jgi:membrane protein involved in colicin uptake
MAAMKLTAILLLSSLTASAQVTLTAMEVRTVHAIMDSEVVLRERAEQDSAQIADLKTALRQSETLRVFAEYQLADTERLRGLEKVRADKLATRLLNEGRKTKGQRVFIWVVGAVAVVETVVIGVAMGTR